MSLRSGRNLLVILTFFATLPLSAQRTERDSALALWSKGLHREALPMLEHLVSTGSKDPEVHIRLGFTLLETSRSLPDTAARRQQRARARTMFVKAVALGEDDLQIKAMIDGIPENGGSDVTFSE